MRSNLALWMLILSLSGGIQYSWSQETGETFTLSGMVVDRDGNPVAGVMVTAFDSQAIKNVTALSQEDGSYSIPNLNPRAHLVRARLAGLDDELIRMKYNPFGGYADGGKREFLDIDFTMKPATDLDSQRTSANLLRLLTWPSKEADHNFRMACTYCHQMGTPGIRANIADTPEFATTIRTMPGFRGLLPEVKENLIPMLIKVYGKGAEADWPAYVPPAPPSGEVLEAIITQWEIGSPTDPSAHDIELGDDGLVYAVDFRNDSIWTLDPKTGERRTYFIPGGLGSNIDRAGKKGPHSIEKAPNGDMWMTLATGGKMAKFDVRTKEFTVVQGGANNRRGAYPHTLRFDNDGILWYTVAGSNGVYRLDPNKKVMIDDVETFDIKRFDLLAADEVTVRGDLRGFARGEGGGITPYGIDIAPDGKVWFTKLNGQRVGVIDPVTEEIVEMKPPVHGPRRLHVAADGKVWVPGFASGDFASYDPKTDEWEVFELPDAMNRIPYALNIHPKTGDVWICGTGSDEIIRFVPSTKEMIPYRMPSLVTYTRELEFDDEGNVWTCNSNYPPRHLERHRGSIIKIALAGN
ncbi:carboxypeptidase regulatory-like domain-containing protein [Candidatus Sumerlaeota bacterium]|nr:carboxypeptidase regulatory-like domain-containing protein [Candidatus Sumerlaeota bacterium]